jgi:DtxR family Mn-dependent transcriptional regulator
MQAAKTENLSASLEDYLEAIFNLAKESSAVHSTDIAKELSVAKPSVTGALRLLKKKGLANYKPYDCVTLTRKGQRLAMQVVRKHNIIKSFFVNILGIDAKVAQQAACKAEHAFGPEVVARLLSFVEFVNSKKGETITEQFNDFYRKNSKKITAKQTAAKDLERANGTN